MYFDKEHAMSGEESAWQAGEESDKKDQGNLFPAVRGIVREITKEAEAAIAFREAALKPEESCAQEEKPSRKIFRGQDERLIKLSRESFADFAICNDLDGELSFAGNSDLGAIKMYAKTEIGTSRNGSNQDGVYVNPLLRTIAGGDGMGRPGFGDLASAFALLNTHLSARESLNAIASRGLEKQFSECGIRWDDRDPPGTTFGFARERNKEGENWIEGFTIGDYRAYVIDITNRRTLFVSKDQSWVQNELDAGRLTKEEAAMHAYRHIVTNAISVDERYQREANFFHISIPEGAKVITILCSDGISRVIEPEEMFRLTIKYGGTVGEVLVEEATLFNPSGDNVSVCVMISG